MRDGGEQDDARWTIAGVILRHGVVDPFAQRGGEALRILVVRLVVPEHGEDHVGLRETEVLIRTGKALAPWPMVDPVPGEPVIAYHELQIRQGGLQVGLEPPVVLHPVREGVPDQDDVIPRRELDLRSRTSDHRNQAQDRDRPGSSRRALGVVHRRSPSIPVESSAVGRSGAMIGVSQPARSAGRTPRRYPSKLKTTG